MDSSSIPFPSPQLYSIMQTTLFRQLVGLWSAKGRHEWNWKAPEGTGLSCGVQLRSAALQGRLCALHPPEEDPLAVSPSGPW